MRIIGANIYGIGISEGWTKWNYTYQNMKESEVEVVGLCETNINWDANKKHTAEIQKREHSMASRLEVSTSSEQSLTNTQRRGTSFFVHNDLVERIAGSGRDD